MPSVEKIQNIKNVSGYAVKNRKGYYNQLIKADEKNGKTIKQFETVGFINTGHTFKAETYSITRLGDEYYKDVFGKWEYLKNRLSGVIERFLKRHI